ncbi:DUF4307 domain-containing protein [Nocardioides sp. C4-1]|uniref:DUF4307 domain-containing protein n=1 Tax=Nocardioides sp. C4-1 TaxID=3151851 RepID=UPI003265DE52
MSSTDLAARYGTRPGWHRWALVALGGALALGAVAFFVAFLPSLASPPVSSGNLTYDVVDDRTAVATFSVDLDDDVDEATCTLKAYAADHTLVGNLAFAVPAGSSRVEQSIATASRATSVELVGCTAPGQNRPR